MVKLGAAAPVSKAAWADRLNIAAMSAEVNNLIFIGSSLFRRFWMSGFFCSFTDDIAVTLNSAMTCVEELYFIYL